MVPKARQNLFLILCGAASLLAGCNTLPFGTAQSPPPTPTAKPNPQRITQAPAPKPAPPKPVQTANTSPPEAEEVVKTVVNAPKPQVKPPVTSLSEESLVGARPSQLRAMIGAPAETTSQTAPSQTWFYASGACRVSVELFKDLDSNTYRSLKYTIEGGSSARCLGQLEHLNRTETDFAAAREAAEAAAALELPGSDG